MQSYQRELEKEIENIFTKFINDVRNKYNLKQEDLRRLWRGEKVEKALNVLRFSSKEASRRLEKLVLSAVANWQSKNEDANIEDADLFVKEITVDGGSMLKRLRPAPQGRAHRIRKRSNHVTVVLGAKNNTQSN